MNEYTDRLCEIELPKDNQNTEEFRTDLTIGVFFDGTLNNKYNLDYAKKTGKAIDDSYQGSYSNVVELYECYDDKQMNIKKIYVEGIGSAEPKENGTSSESSDSTRGYAWGTGKSGVNSKIERGCKLISREVSELIKTKKTLINTLTLDVFGFSRGAAAARSFVSQIEKILGTKTENKKVSLRQWVGIKKVSTIKVRFLGVFDTVSSFNPGWGYERFYDDVEELSLRIPTGVKQTVQLVAADEYRKYFALTNINSAGSKGKQIILPGAHSDIGGGYAASEPEDIIMYTDRMGRPDVGYRSCRGYMSLQQLYDEKWIPSNWSKNNYLKNDGIFDIQRRRGRYVKNDYAKIPLAMMGTYANKTNYCFSSKLNQKSKIENNLKGLSDIKTRIMSIIDGGALLYKINTGRVTFIGSNEDLFKIRNIRAEYQHLSARNKIGHNATSNNVRTIYNG